MVQSKNLNNNNNSREVQSLPWALCLLVQSASFADCASPAKKKLNVRLLCGRRNRAGLVPAIYVKFVTKSSRSQRGEKLLRVKALVRPCESCKARLSTTSNRIIFFSHLHSVTAATTPENGGVVGHEILCPLISLHQFKGKMVNLMDRANLKVRGLEE